MKPLLFVLTACVLILAGVAPRGIELKGTMPDLSNRHVQVSCEWYAYQTWSSRHIELSDADVARVIFSICDHGPVFIWEEERPTQ